MSVERRWDDRGIHYRVDIEDWDALATKVAELEAARRRLMDELVLAGQAHAGCIGYGHCSHVASDAFESCGRTQRAAALGGEGW
ncbi:MAG: hypothetical protein ACYTAN_13790 [Planctomycetota bacterium]|jgi:hypothetical protein